MCPQYALLFDFPEAMTTEDTQRMILCISCISNQLADVSHLTCDLPAVHCALLASPVKLAPGNTEEGSYGESTD